MTRPGRRSVLASGRRQKLYQRLGFQPLRAPMGSTGHFGCDRWYALDLIA